MTVPLHTSPVEIVAHRGYAALFPENTMIAFRRALHMGADALEIDVHHSAEGVPVVIHDGTLDRTTDRSGPVRSKTVGELQQADAGIKFHPDYAGSGIPLLEEVLALLSEGRAGLQLELKEHINEQEAAGLLHLLDTYKLTERTIIISFHVDNLRLIRNLHPTIEVGWLSDKLVDIDILTGLGHAALLLQYRTVMNHPDIVATAQEKGFSLAAWTIRDEADARKLYDLGVRRITTDIPLKGVLPASASE
ncbi:glycerophosphodiester phosphodiesterase family protein [Paenibacillus thiaminolyticus]|uniref:Glycerophosphodiester phosphodiesterase n=1 Tax=Paenibacillus thiaminolyticus TaxID=49283 RepID=A0A3A3GHL1_PANTH|nr:glycerophosphodiester phosphodiesterase family protein [Paenibacillus thiaminolyticus]RJG22598.1 glycerophosphodiester phosphodiesterase [Paenibacillus thiaminolyticus]